MVYIKHCWKCGATDNLIKSTVRYHICNPCNTARINKYYHSLTGEKKKKFIERANRWRKTLAGRAHVTKYMKQYKKHEKPKA